MSFILHLVPKIVYYVGYIDLTKSQDDLWRDIDARTEIRKAEKSGITIECITGMKDPIIVARCQELQRALFARELIPYDEAAFSAICSDSLSMMGIARMNNSVISCIVVKEQPDISWKDGKVARLEISATDSNAAQYCPNYLLIWQMSEWLRQHGYKAFNLDLLYFKNAPDPDLARVASFKRKWAVTEVERIGHVSWPHYLYIKFLKRFSAIKKLVYMVRRA